VFIRLAGCSVLSGPRVTAIPAPTNLAISSGVSMVATCARVGSLVPGGGLPVGRFWAYRSSSPSLGGGEGEGEGEPIGCWGLCGGLVPPPPVAPAALTSGRGGSGGLDGGIAGNLCLRVAGAGASRIGLLRIGRFGKGGGAGGTVLVLGALAGLRQSCSGLGEGALAPGDPGRGIQVASRRISSLARRRSSSTWLIFLSWSVAHSSTLP